MHGTAQRRVEQGRRVATVDDADQVVVLLARRALEDGAALTEFDPACACASSRSRFPPATARLAINGDFAFLGAMRT
jgi:hypothetical protein